MCGITGAIALTKQAVDVASAKPMADNIAHRGPDDAGYLFFHSGTRHQDPVSFYQNLTDEQFKNVEDMLPTIESRSAQRELHSHDWDMYFGHRRLSILDLTHAGHQPMSDLSKNIWLVYNGEIYNFIEIKAELKKCGHQFKTHTDTEVIIYAYIEWGIDCIHKFNGMFAFALFDNRNKQVYLVRDRYGIKPLYYTLLPDNTLLFGSEIKSLLAYQDCQPGLDYEALLEYFTFQNIFTDKTFHQDIKLLPAGHVMQINLQAKQPDIKTTQYWDFDFSHPEKVKDEREYIEELDRLFQQAVQRQLVSDVEVGSYLSGGMDSGSITAIAAQTFPYLKTFTIGFDLSSASGIELGFDERAQSEYLSYLFKTEHYEMVLKSGDMERCLPKFAYHLEEPRVGQSYPNYYAAQLASKFVKVVLSGAGGDELFGGYPWRYYRAVNNSNFDDYINKYYGFWKRLVNNKQLQQLFAPITDKTKQVWTEDIFRNVFKTPEVPQMPEEYVNHSLYFEAKTFLHGLLVVEDKLSMAHSLESRVPFLDNDLVDFAQKVPVNLKVGNIDAVAKIKGPMSGEQQKKYLHKSKDGKLILRKAMQCYIPNKVTGAEKQGFSSPDQSWFKGESIEFVKQRLLSDDSVVFHYFDKSLLQQLIGDHLQGKENKRLLIWSLLSFDAWYGQYG